MKTTRRVVSISSLIVALCFILIFVAPDQRVLPASASGPEAGWVHLTEEEIEKMATTDPAHAPALQSHDAGSGVVASGDNLTSPDVLDTNETGANSTLPALSEEPSSSDLKSSTNDETAPATSQCNTGATTALPFMGLVATALILTKEKRM